MSYFKIACPNCDQQIACNESHYGLQINCPNCGIPIRVPAAPRQPPSMHAPQQGMPHPSKQDDNAWLTTWLLSLFLGGIGVDRFYNGRTGLGIAKLLTSLLTCGLIGIFWVAIDFILLMLGWYKDARGNYVSRPPGRYVALQVIGIILATSFGVGCLALALPVFRLLTHSNSRSQSSVTTTDPLNSVYRYQVTTLQEWQRVPGPFVRVEANPRYEARTEKFLTSDDHYQLYPCPTDRWSANPPQWSEVDYRGHLDVNAKTASGRPYMQLCYQVGDSDVQAVEMGTIASGQGRLRLFPSGQNSDGNVWNNAGFIRVKMVKTGPPETHYPMPRDVSDCQLQLSLLGDALRSWAWDHNDQFPFNVPTAQGGTLEYCQTNAEGFDENAFHHLLVLSNDLGKFVMAGPVPQQKLLCPADKTKTPAKNWSDLGASNVSYQLRSGAEVSQSNPNEVLARCPIHGITLYCDGRAEVSR